MAGNSRPSFLKRQKEQKRLERANAKRADRQARREARGTQPGGGDGIVEATDEGFEVHDPEAPEPAEEGNP